MMIPLIYWIKAVIVYIILAIELIVAAPVWLIAFALPEGEGLVGQHARKGLVQMIDIAIRPPLLTTFACIAHASSHLISLLITAIFAKWVNAAVSYMAVDIAWQFIIAIIFNSMIYIGTLTVFFHLLVKAPQSVITWIGGLGMSIGSVEQSADKETTVIGGVIGKGAGAASGVGAGVAGMGKGLQQKKDDGGDKKPKSDGNEIGSIAPKTPAPQ